MRSYLIGIMSALFLLALAGCEFEAKSSTAMKNTDSKNIDVESQTKARVSDTEAEVPTNLAEDDGLPPIDVREPGAPAISQDENPSPSHSTEPAANKEDAAASDKVTVPPYTPSESPLQDIRPPDEEEPEPQYVEKQTIEIPKNWTRITPVGESEVWIDVGAKQVMTAGVICLQHGGLEMFVCPLNTKEHESVIAVNSASYQIHAALLGIGITPGHPVEWHPEYKAATGPRIEIDVMWKDPDSEQVKVIRAQNMIRNFQTKKILDLDWVFGGSVLETDQETGKSFYYADGGEMVCLSNFSTAMLDLPIESSDSNNDLLYEANPDAIPEPGTKVYVIFKPKIEHSSASKKE